MTSRTTFAEVEGPRVVELHLPRLDLREIEHVVDELEQVVALVEDVAQVLLVVGGDRPDLPVVHELREADDRVERRAQLVRHVGEELALEAVRLLHPPVLLGQLLGLALLHCACAR